MVGPESTNWRARWLYELRLSRPAIGGKKKLTQAEFADELARSGVTLSKKPGASADAQRIAYNRLEKGTDEAPDELLAQLADLYKAAPATAPATPPPAGDQSAIVAALDRQTAAIERQADALIALVARLDRLAQGQEELAEEVGAIVDPELARRRIEEARTETLRAQRRRSHRPRGGPRPSLEQEPEMQSRGV